MCKRTKAVCAVLRHKIKDAQQLADAEIAAIKSLENGDTAHRAINKGLAWKTH